MNLCEFMEWRALHPSEPLFSCGSLNGQIHLISWASSRQFGTRCGLQGRKDQILVFMMPIDTVSCLACKRRVK